MEYRLDRALTTCRLQNVIVGVLHKESLVGTVCMWRAKASLCLNVSIENLYMQYSKLSKMN